jgi:hypothetical protein
VTVYYLLAVEGGVTPELSGPYLSEADMLAAARELDAAQDRDCDSLFPLLLTEAGIEVDTLPPLDGDR